mmetsp:Transcript_61957/g.134263  ORF Transcript_61957/g.134263 Transcript_61957/m.134263 type:complete len:210 (-) Transcript_61957:91-720(-)
MGHVMAPSLTTSRMSSPLRPHLVPIARPSLKATRLMPIIMLTTSFILAPQPTSPRKKVRLPMTSKQGWASSCKALSPAERMTSWPWRAGPLEPDTGPSRKRPPFAVIAAAISFTVSSSTVDMSMYFFPALMPLRMPSGPKTTALAEQGSEVQAKVISHVWITSAGVEATLAPFSARGLHFSWERFQTVTGKPASMRRPAMAEPIIPMPT